MTKRFQSMGRADRDDWMNSAKLPSTRNGMIVEKDEKTDVLYNN